MTVGAFMLALEVILQFCERAREMMSDIFLFFLSVRLPLHLAFLSLSLYAYTITLDGELFVMANFAKIACITRTRRLMVNCCRQYKV